MPSSITRCNSQLCRLQFQVIKSYHNYVFIAESITLTLAYENEVPAVVQTDLEELVSKANMAVKSQMILDHLIILLLLKVLF